MDKQTANHVATGAPGSIELDGKTYLVGQPTDADFVAVRRYLNKTFTEKAKSPIAATVAEINKIEGLSAEDRATMLKEAVALQPSGPRASTEAFTDLLFEPEACSFLAWLLIRKNHQEVTLEDIRATITDENLDSILADLFKASGLADLEKNGRGRTGSGS